MHNHAPALVPGSNEGQLKLRPHSRIAVRKLPDPSLVTNSTNTSLGIPCCSSRHRLHIAGLANTHPREPLLSQSLALQNVEDPASVPGHNLATGHALKTGHAAALKAGI